MAPTTAARLFARATFAVGLFGRERERRVAAANKTHHGTLSQPPKNLTASVAALKAELNATKAALATDVALKLGGGATVDATLPRLTGDVTCYVDDATGDVVGLQLGSSAPLCSMAGTPRSFAVPADGYIADVKVVVDKATGLVGELLFVVKSNASLVPTNVVTCGTHVGVGVSVMPKLAALAGVTASCKSAQSGRRLHQAGGSGLALDPVSLSVVATTVNAPAPGWRLAAVVLGQEGVLTSTDGGATWTERTTGLPRSADASTYWQSIASSSDGNKLAAVSAFESPSKYGKVYTSADGGATWTQRVPFISTPLKQANWWAIASSSDGNKLAVVNGGILGFSFYSGSIYTSSDGGATWTERTNAGSRSWLSIASSSDGTKLAAGSETDGIFTSSDGGSTWTQSIPFQNDEWDAITSSSDGNKLAVASFYGSIRTSTDGGLTWYDNAPINNPQRATSITSSSDGTKLAFVTAGSAGIAPGEIWTSTNGACSGPNCVSWSKATTGLPPSSIFNPVPYETITSSFDGTKLAAGIYGGSIYTSSDGGATWTEQTNAGSRSWQSIASSA